MSGIRCLFPVLMFSNSARCETRLRMPWLFKRDNLFKTWKCKITIAFLSLEVWKRSFLLTFSRSEERVDRWINKQKLKSWILCWTENLTFQKVAVYDNYFSSFSKVANVMKFYHLNARCHLYFSLEYLSTSEIILLLQVR